VACDLAPVISLATKQKFTSNTCLARDFTVCLVNGQLTITNAKKGEATDITDNGTGFTYTTCTQGTRTTVEVLTYEYDTNGRLKCITTLSGEHLVDLNELQNNNTGIYGDGNLARVSDYGELQVGLAPNQESLLCKILTQLKIANLHLSLVSDEKILEKDVKETL
jgi:YD repeat-containing protein